MDTLQFAATERAVANKRYYDTEIPKKFVPESRARVKATLKSMQMRKG